MPLACRMGPVVMLPILLSFIPELDIGDGVEGLLV